MKKMLSNKIFYRFEPNLSEDGTLVIFFMEDNTAYELTKPYYIFLHSIECGLTNKEMVSLYKDEYPELSNQEIEGSMNQIESTLIEIGVLL